MDGVFGAFLGFDKGSVLCARTFKTLCIVPLGIIILDVCINYQRFRQSNNFIV